MDLGLKGKNVVVTGGTHGIGFSIAMEFAKQGSNIAVCSRTEERVDYTLKKLKSDISKNKFLFDEKRKRGLEYSKSKI